MFKKYLLIFLIVGTLLGRIAADEAVGDVAADELVKRRIAILPAVNMSQLEEYDYIRSMLNDSLKNSLLNTNSFFFIDEAKISGALTLNNIADGDTIWEDDAIGLGEYLGADIVIICSFAVKENDLTIMFNAIDIKARRSAVKLKIPAAISVKVLDDINKASSDMTVQMTKEFSPYQKRFEDFKRILIGEIKVTGADKDAVSGIVTQVTDQINNRKKYLVVDDGEKEQVLKDMNLLKTDKFTLEKQLQIAAKLSSELMFVGDLKKNKGVTTLKLEVYEVKTGVLKCHKDVVFTNLKTLNAGIADIVDLIHKPGRQLTTKNKIGIPLVSGGGVALVAGSVMLLYDLVYYYPSIVDIKEVKNIRNDYGYFDYKDSFNTYTGLLAGGIVLAVIGGGLLISGVPLIVYREMIFIRKNKKAEVKTGIDLRAQGGMDLYFAMSF